MSEKNFESAAITITICFLVAAGGFVAAAYRPDAAIDCRGACYPNAMISFNAATPECVCRE